MAYVRSTQTLRTDEEEEAPSTQRMLAGPGGAPVPGRQPQRLQVSGPPAPSTPGRFVNFSQVLGANRDAANATAGKVRQGVQQQADAAEGARGTAWEGFRNAVKAGTNTYEAGRADAAQRATQGYAGPGSLAAMDGYEGLEKQTQEAAGAVDATKDSAGLQAVMQRQGMAASTTGGKRFDAGLVGNAGRKDFAGLRNRYGGLQAALDKANTHSEGVASWAKDSSNYAAQDYATEVKQKQEAADAEAKRKADETAQREVEAKQAVEDAEVWEKLAVKDNFFVAKELTPGFGQTQADVIAEIEADPKRQAAIDKYHGPGTWAAIRRHLARTKNKVAAMDTGGVAGGGV